MTTMWMPRLAQKDRQPVAAMRAMRAVVPGGGEEHFALKDGDRITIIDPEGLQVAELYVAGNGTLARLGGTTLRPAREATAAAARSDNEASDGQQPHGRPLLALAGDQPAGAAITYEALGALTLAVHAPGKAMAPADQDTPTDLVVDLLPAEPSPGSLPPPLSNAVTLDLRIAAATAEAFTVKAGDYIQIIDVDGRQCSDFLAFDAEALAEGVEYDLDATVTRTLMGASFSSPGLHSKYFDRRMRPLVEVVQDTVGRHDTFLLACSAKYYEDMGYPGHSNCTDNFNAALADHGVKPRAGWPAINFFFNTSVDANDGITMDEPWSRPGDYVLLRALTDLVCASSSCADDIDPANAWEPTDIHVRVYDGEKSSFISGSAHRMTGDAEPNLARASGFHARTSALTRKFEEYRGRWVPTCFSGEGPIAEYWACRENAVVTDLSALRKFEVTGPEAETLMQLAVPRNVKKLAIGQVVYTPLLYDHGGMIDDGTIFRLGQDNFRLVCGDDYSGLWLRELAAKHGLKAFVRNSTAQLDNLALQGPHSGEILRRVLTTPPHQPSAEELKWFRFTIGRIADRPVVVSRTGYTGELGFEIWCHPTSDEAVWDAVFAAGEPLGLKPMGLAALDMVRIEAGLVFAGYDFSDETDPFEAGIGFTIPKDSTDPYVGQAAIERRRVSPQKALVGLDVVGNEAVSHGDCVHVGRARVGVVTSAMRSPILGKTIALARLDASLADIGTAVEIGKLDGQQKRLAATVTRFPHYDPDKTRVRADWASAEHSVG